MNCYNVKMGFTQHTIYILQVIILSINICKSSPQLGILTMKTKAENVLVLQTLVFHSWKMTS